MRPLSPHLLIYKPQITSIMSIAHRICGIGFLAALIIFIMGIFCYMNNEQTWTNYVKFYHLIYGKIWARPLMLCVHYHAINGIRYFAWSLGIGFELQWAKRSGIFVLLTSVITTVCFFKFIYAACCGRG